MPSVPRYTGRAGDSRINLGDARSVAESVFLHAEGPRDVIPDREFSFFDAITRPAAPARITSPISTGGMYDLPR